MSAMQCRPGCGACCIAPSISTPIPDPRGGVARSKPAGERCVQLGTDGLCGLWGSPLRPAVCGGLQASVEMCGTSTREAMVNLERLWRATNPDTARRASARVTRRISARVLC